MDASVLAALPWSVQKELIERLPRGRQQQQPDAAQPSSLAQRLDAAAPAPAGAVGGEAQQQRQQQQQQQKQDQPEAMQLEEVSAQEARQQQHQQPGRPQAAETSSDEEAGWEPDSPPAAVAPSAAHAPGYQQQQQQQPGGPDGHHAAPHGGRAAGAAIAALPAFSQVDPSVLEALPLEMRWELERAYGEHAAAPAWKHCCLAGMLPSQACCVQQDVPFCASSLIATDASPHGLQASSGRAARPPPRTTGVGGAAVPLRWPAPPASGSGWIPL